MYWDIFHYIEVMEDLKDRPTMVMSNTWLISKGNICPQLTKKWPKACASGTSMTFGGMPFDA
jgi:hypothetical protein